MSPYREIEHTADWAIQVWAPTLAELFVDAARGMYALMGARPAESSGVRRHVAVEAEDYEALLVGWLQELVYYTEIEHLAFERFEVNELLESRLAAEAVGGPMARLDKLIKAVTYHNLRISRTDRGYETTLVFDV